MGFSQADLSSCHHGLPDCRPGFLNGHPEAKPKDLDKIASDSSVSPQNDNNNIIFFQHSHVQKILRFAQDDRKEDQDDRKEDQDDKKEDQDDGKGD